MTRSHIKPFALKLWALPTACLSLLNHHGDPAVAQVGRDLSSLK